MTVSIIKGELLRLRSGAIKHPERIVRTLVLGFNIPFKTVTCYVLLITSETLSVRVEQRCTACTKRVALLVKQLHSSRSQ